MTLAGDVGEQVRNITEVRLSWTDVAVKRDIARKQSRGHGWYVC